MKSNDAKKKKTTDTLFFAPDIRQNQQLPEQESQHCVKVLRLTEGDSITVTDGKGYFYDCTIIQAHHKRTVVAIESESHQPKSWNFNLTIAFAPTKNNDRTEWFAEKATEIGIDAFIPVICRFSEKKELKTNRMERIVVAAMKQSQQSVFPVIHRTISFDHLMEIPFTGEKYIAHCYDKDKKTLPEIYQKGSDAVILIGPEGDFSEEEIQKAIEKGFKPVSLGNNRLRTETAALAACHTIHVLNM